MKRSVFLAVLAGLLVSACSFDPAEPYGINQVRHSSAVQGSGNTAGPGTSIAAPRS
ncbi:hypothetical protein SAMN06265795_10816 [Noviherbaspirillum humi]|uniref:Lipoprotein-attachment site-containing protein n=1 Tax=Noviherbaspirillum humi TaxID=1688639 RepID=A0A239HYU8_9BURK|nr:hypothetical protein [Noviherbaspirillum humi]SNS86372.1 hypothetical protein SAMN06265795_10816 [Noviherbaspirillum humi]